MPSSCVCQTRRCEQLQYRPGMATFCSGTPAEPENFDVCADYSTARLYWSCRQRRSRRNRPDFRRDLTLIASTQANRRVIRPLQIRLQSNVPGLNPPPCRRSAFSQSGLTERRELAEHIGLAGPQVPPMKKLPLAGGAGATFSRSPRRAFPSAVGWRSARSLPPSGGSFFKIGDSRSGASSCLPRDPNRGGGRAKDRLVEVSPPDPASRLVFRRRTPMNRL
jgi:hypothetical protein